MPLPFDATLKDLVATHMDDFGAILKLLPSVSSRVLNVDLSVVSAATDIVIGHGDPVEAITDLNFVEQASHINRPQLARSSWCRSTH
ncbi:MAG: hypothetical protein O3A00_23090 [Planctomycetota bacterium]|nr:hypothetical protein [Planctomycetota bacterium]